ncbi:hypothetical protein KM043_016335 [Ampulex compressa]|nr:hypothetical protein KM043_016335 [Ampulex compressa]
MTELQQRYKRQVFAFGNATESRRIRAEKQQRSRKQLRDKIFSKNRDLPEPEIEKPSNKGDRLQQLLKWKVEREKLRKLELKKKKPAFKVGIVHHKLYSPLTKDVTPIPSNSTKPPSPAKRITRATEKRLLAKTIGEASQKNVTKIPILQSNSGINKKQKNLSKKKEESFAPPNHKFKPPSFLSSIPPFGRIPVQYTPVAEKKKSLLLSLPASEEMDDHIITKEKPCVNVESSIEAIKLRLSSDDSGTFSSYHENNSPLKNNKVLNNSRSKESTLKNSTVLDDSSTEESAVKNVSLISVQTSSPKEPVFFSPYIVLSRGKNNARKEQQVRRGLGRSPSDIPTKENVMKNLNISIEDEERTAQYFKFILNREVDRLTDLCSKWTQIKSEANVTEDAQYQINQAVGQTQLLMNKKFERFRKLVSDCETGKGEMLVTCKDLQGFWDMTYMEVKDCDSRFDKLKKLRANAWIEDQPESVKPVIRKKVTVKKKTISAKQSSIRSLILAERKKKAVQNVENMENADDIVFHSNSRVKISTNSEKSNTKEFKSNKRHSTRKSLTPSTQKNRRSKSFGPNQQAYTPAKQDNARLSLLHKVQLSETSKKLRSPLCIMKISKMCKTPEVQLDDTILYVNSDQTPGKSILKRSEDIVEAESRTRSTHKVNFDDDIVLNEVPVDEELKTKLNLAAALAKIDSYDFDSEAPNTLIHAERKLNFDNDSSDEAEDMFRAFEKSNYNEFKGHSTLSIKNPNETFSVNTKLVPLKETILKDVPSTPSPRNGLKEQGICDNTDEGVKYSVSNISPISFHEKEIKEESDICTRTLRSRTVTTMDTYKVRRKSVRDSVNENESERKENKTPKTRRSSLKVSNKNQQKGHVTNDINNALEKISLNETVDKKRRSSRKSVKFTAEDCTACAESKPTLPMTPHLKRTKTRFSENQSNISERDLISWNTPEKLPARIRRSSQHRKV